MWKKNLIIYGMVLFCVLMVALTQPRTVNWFNYDDLRIYILWLSGHLAMVVIVRQVLLWIRPFSSGRIRDFFRVNKVHKWLGIATLAMIILHPVATVVAYATSWIYAFSFDFSSWFEMWVTFGKIAFDIIIIVLFSSILSRKILSFRSRYRMHLLSYPAYFAIWFHWWNTGTMIMNHTAVRWYRVVLGVALIVVTVVRIAYQFGFLKYKAQIIQHIQLTEDIYEISFQIREKLSYKPGQFVYLQMNSWGESHPFTVLSYEWDILKIAYKVFGSFTKALSKVTVMSHNPMYIDGPYGEFTQDIDGTYSTVCIAGGIGVTPFIQLLKVSQDKDISLIFLNKHRSDVIYKDMIEECASKYIHILSRETDKQDWFEIVWKRIDSAILQGFLGEKLLQARYYVCGGWAVIMSAVGMLSSLWVPMKHIQWEPFEM